MTGGGWGARTSNLSLLEWWDLGEMLSTFFENHHSLIILKQDCVLEKGEIT